MEENPDQPRDDERQRKTLRHIEDQSVRFLTFSCFDRLPLFGNAAIRTAFCEHLEHVRAARAFQVVAYCVMPEHVHLVINPRTADNQAKEVLFHLKRPFAATVLARWRKLNAGILKQIAGKKGKPHFWLHSGGFDRNVRANRLAGTVHYVNQNPVERGLCAFAEDWLWSSARFYKTGKQGLVKVVRAASA